MKKWICILLSLALAMACCVVNAEDTDGESLADLGKEAYMAGDYAKALEYWEQASEKDNARAVHNLGLLYETGSGVEQDYAKAMEYYKRSADLGLPLSLTDMADLYKDGKGVEQDYAKAIELYTQAAEKGEVNAQESLGYMYCNGIGAETDYAKALEYYSAASEQGGALAIHNLGWMYENGIGVETDYTKAYEYYIKGAELGNELSYYALGLMHYEGKGVEQDYEKTVVAWGTSAALGYEGAYEACGELYRDGLGVQKNDAKAADYFLKAVELGNPAEAQANYNRMVEEGRIPADYTIDPDMDPWCDLGVFFIEKGDLETGVACFTNAAAQGNCQGIYNLGVAYAEGWGVEQDYERAADFFLKAIELGSTEARKYYDNLVKEGKIPEDYVAKEIDLSVK